MGTATAADINRRAVYLLQDSGLNTGSTAPSSADGPGINGESNLRWSVDEMLLWITDAQRAIVELRPNSNNVVAVVPLVAGPRQMIPDDGWILLTVNANMVGSEYGRAVTLATFDQLNRQLPNWRADRKSATAYNYMFDLTDQKAFYVWPPNDGTGAVELNYSAIPKLITDLTQAIEIDNIFVPMMVDYVAGRASMKDAEFGPGLQYNNVFMQNFMTALGGKDAGEKEQNPDAAMPPGSNR